MWNKLSEWVDSFFQFIIDRLKDLFYTNNELSLTRFFLFTGFTVAMIGIVGMFYGWIPLKQEFVDIIKWIIGFVLGGKTMDNLSAQVWGSKTGEMPPVKNPKV